MQHWLPHHELGGQVGVGGEGWIGTQQLCPECQYQDDGQDEPDGGDGGEGWPPWGTQHLPFRAFHKNSLPEHSLTEDVVGGAGDVVGEGGL